MDESRARSKGWLDFAVMDLESARYLTGMRPQPLEIICYHCQQSIEKALKGYLLFHGAEAPKMHDLVRLCELCAGIDEQFVSLGRACAQLSAYGVQARYPAQLDVTTEDMEQALSDCESTLAFVQKKLEQTPQG